MNCTLLLKTVLPVAAAAVLLLVAGAPLLAQQTNNYVLRAVPAPGKVTLDGKLDDWDLSGEILMCYDLETMLDNHSVRAAAMYDRDWLYLSFRFKDRTPMLNHVNPQQRPGSGWVADCVQIRLWADDNKPVGPGGGRITHIDCYYYTEEKRPTAYVQYNDMSRKLDGLEGTIPEAIGQGVDAAFLEDADGKGYTQEMRIAWKHLRRDGRPYGAGETLRMGLECFWGGPDASKWYEHRLTDLLNQEMPQREFFWSNNNAWGKVEFLDHGKLEPSPSIQQLSDVERLARLRYSTSGPVSVPYRLPLNGFATLVVEKPDGTRVRNLISNYPREQGDRRDYWDGTDDSGRLVAPGAYRVRGLYHGPLDIQYQFSYGNPGNPPWETSDGKGNWLSDHSNPMDVLADAERVYAVAPTSENGNTLIALDFQGHRLWGLNRIGGGFLARTGDYLYMACDEGGGQGGWGGSASDTARVELIRVDPRTGKLASFPDGKSNHEVATWKPSTEGYAREGEGATIARHGHNADWCNIQAQGLAAIGSTLYMSMHFAGKLLKLDAEQGTVLGEIPVPAPAGVATDGARLYVVSGRQVVEVNPDSGQLTPVVTEGLSAPLGLAVDKSSNLYVSDWADQMCVKVFSPAGKLLRTVGKPGGRAWVGAYDPQAMLLPRGISLDAQGRLWVAEDDYSPRRISCWNPDGTLALEKLGTTWYSGGGCYLFPDNPTRGIVMGNLVELDWKTGQWRVRSTLWRSTQPNALLGFDYFASMVAVRKYQGRTFLMHSSNNGATVISELKGDVAVPLAAWGSCFSALPNLYDTTKGGLRPNPLFADHLWTDPRVNAQAQRVIPWYFSGPRAGDYTDPIKQLGAIFAGLPNVCSPNNNFIWSDLNGNGEIDPDEITYYPTPHLNAPDAAPWGAAGWTNGLLGPDLAGYPSATYKGQTHVWRLPVVRWAPSGAPVYDPAAAQMLVKDTGESPDPTGAGWRDSQGNLLCNQIPLTMYKPTGQPAWTYPNPWPSVHGSHRAPQAQNGRLIGPLQVIGSATLGEGVGEIFTYSGNLGQAFVFTTDGLYVADMFRDCRSAPEVLPDKPARGMSIIQTTCGGEWFGGQFFRNAQDGKLYLVNGASNVSQVLGLESTRRLPTQSVSFTPEQYKQASALLAQRVTAEGAAHQLTILPARRSFTTAPPEDGFDWREEATATWQFDGQHSAQATWNYDAKNLYVCFRNVLDATPMINGGKDPQILFKTGDADVLELRTDPASAAPGVVAGDLRLLFSVFNGQPLAVLYRYKVPGTAGATPFTSPVSITNIDVVKILDTAQVAIDRQSDRYTLRATVPLAELGFTPAAGQTYRGDFGIVYSDRAGRIDELRMYWCNPVTGMVNDLATEAQIEPQFWGKFTLPVK